MTLVPPAASKPGVVATNLATEDGARAESGSFLKHITHDRVMDLAMGFWASKVLLSAVELGVFGVLDNGPLDLRALRSRTRLHDRSAHDFFDALVALGLLQRDDAGRYSNTAEADLYLNPARPGYIGGIIEMFNARLYGFWGSLTEALRTGAPQNEAKQGGDLFANLSTDPVRLEAFLHAMTGQALPVAHALAQAFPWHEVNTVIDIGTAQGCLPVQLALAHPHLTGGGFDLPAAGPIFSRFVASHALADRLQFFPGDFLVGELPRADVLVMGLILHDWDLPTKRMLLRKAYAALEKGGSLIVYEFLIDDDRRVHVPGLLMSLNMLIETRGGFDYTGADCIGWMNEAGFSDTRVVPLAGPHSAVIATK